MRRKREEGKLTRTHFGPEETEEVMEQSANDARQKKAYLEKELARQIAVACSVTLRKGRGRRSLPRAESRTWIE